MVWDVTIIIIDLKSCYFAELLGMCYSGRHWVDLLQGCWDAKVRK